MNPDRFKKKPSTEVEFMGILGLAFKAGNKATEDWDPNNWFPCGAGHVLVKPRNSRFAKWLLENAEHFYATNAIHIRNAELHKAIIISNHRFNQSMQPQVDWASAVSRVLREHGIKSTMWSYID